MPTEKNYFTELYAIDLTDKAREKGKLTYLPWAAVWAEVKKLHPDANYEVYENSEQRPWFDDGRTAWVKTGVTINGIEHIERLPIMDFKNQSIIANKVASTDANKAIQRSITKACARHGVGLHIFMNEDLPEAVTELQDQNEINFKLATSLAKIGEAEQKLVGETVRKFEKTGNPKRVSDLDVAEKLYDALLEIKSNRN